MRTLAVVTATRAEYGLLRWLMADLRADPALRLQLIVTGAHLSAAHGDTVREIERDGFAIDARVDMELGGDDGPALARAMGLCCIGMGEALGRLRPDLLVVLGDRYELLPICSAATVVGVPIAHLSGGDLTEGALDDQVRHAVSKLAHLHFPGTQASAERLLRMGEPPDRVFMVGEPALDNFRRGRRLPRAELARSLGLDPARRWVVFTYHPETRGSLEVDLGRVERALDALGELEVQVLMTWPNADPGGVELGRRVEARHQADPDRFRLVKNVGQDRFVSLLWEAWLMVGNSSAGIVEAASARLPVLNLGDRQKGRLAPRNVVSLGGTAPELRAALAQVASEPFRASLEGLVNPYGDGHSSERIKQLLATVPLEGLLRKPFHDAPGR